MRIRLAVKVVLASHAGYQQYRLSTLRRAIQRVAGGRIVEGGDPLVCTDCVETGRGTVSPCVRHGAEDLQ